MFLALFLIILTIFGGVVLNLILFKIFERRLVAHEERTGIPLKKRFYAISRVLIPILLLLLVIPALPVAAETSQVIRKALSVVFILMTGWLAVKAVMIGREMVLNRYDINVKDNLKARAIHTQMNMLVKILVVTIALIATASSLMVFDNVRHIGTSILASAGVIGIIIGFAAQRSIATLLAGLQLAITQPIRIDDVVIVDGEWGKIEEITLTYVVVCIWDLRRLIVPTSYFLEKSFQNWTRTSADLLATVMIYADYSLPVDVVRNQLHEIIKDHALWDGKVWRLHVTNATEQTIELRALMSAASSSDAWELRCDVREQLLRFLQTNYPDCLPKIRAAVLGSSS
ncbi:MAG: mechanosensitive ion channel family protein [Desulfuromonadales bacterium]